MSGETRFENHQEAESRETISKGKVKQVKKKSHKAQDKIAKKTS